jgi:polyketide synthase 12
MAAVQLARHLGARVFGTASPGKWAAVRALGVDEARLASSRTTEFEASFRAATEGHGVDVVLDSLAGEFVDASLRLTAAGGRFIEMGKTDLRDPVVIADSYRVTYRAFDLMDAGPDLIAAMLAVLGGLFAAGALVPLPVTCWDVRRAPDAFRYLSQARHIGKVVLTIPAPDREGTVLVTGGSGGLGGLVARHLAGRGRRHLVLASRRGAGAPGLAGLAAGLAGAGAGVRVVACDAADRPGLAAVIAAAPAHAPLTGVVHAAGVLDDGVTGSLTPARLDRVMRPKADGAWHLHELTRDLDLDMFVLFSAAAGIWGNPGQGNYAAANTFLDALAAHRRGLGLGATSLAWGPWLRPGGMTGGLDQGDWQRMARLGLRPLSDTDGLALLDAAVAAGEALLVPARLDLSELGRPGAEPPPLLSGLVRPSRAAARAAGAGATGAAGVSADGRGGLAARLAAMPAAEQGEAIRQVVLAQAALVLGLAGPEAADSGRSFRELGFDSLTAVELRNRLNAVTGLRLPATVVFDYPTPGVLATHLGAELGGTQDEEAHILAAFSWLEKIETAQALLTGNEAARAQMATRLKGILSALNTAGDAADGELADRIQSASDDDIFDFIDNQLGV